MRKVLFLIFVLSTCVTLGHAGDQGPTAGDLRASGVVRLDVTCAPEVKQDFQSAVALLHSFFYEEARTRFEEIARRDPQCAMAWWGVAMTWYHPLWTAPMPAEMELASAAVAQAQAIEGLTDLERGLIAAIDAFFGAEEPQEALAEATSCHGPRAHGARAAAFRSALERLHRQYPDNLEVAVFYSLSLLATAILEPLFEKHPDHPGIPHYIIHAYDYPSLASRGLPAARHYGEVAPWVPHALHMPSHIYTRLGMWHESIQANLASADAARKYTARVAGGAVWYDELHALDYLAFAYLQGAQDGKARELNDYVRGLRNFYQLNFAAAYALGAIPARYALERHDWATAASLETPHADKLEAYPFALAHSEFARAIGNANLGKTDAARIAVGRLEELSGALAGGDNDEALRLMRDAVALETRSGTHPVTPGQILPANEQLGDLLLLLKRPDEALAAYEQSLDAFPNRFNGHYGAGRAAELASKPDIARRHYRQVMELAAEGDGRREELDQVKKYLATPAPQVGAL